MMWIVLIVLAITSPIAWSVHSTKKRREYLISKYNNIDIVERIMQQFIWVGQTSEQLVDSLGDLEDKSIKRMKTRYRVVWKYHQTGKNRYGLRITLDDDVVQTRDKK